MSSMPPARPIPSSTETTIAAGARLRPRAFRLGVGQCRLGQDTCADAARHPADARRRAAVVDPVPDLYQAPRRAKCRTASSSGCRDWTTLDDEELAEEIAEIEGRAAERNKLRPMRENCSPRRWKRRAG